MVAKTGTQKLTAGILVNPSIKDETPPDQKMILAHEWLHAMIAFTKRINDYRHIAEKLEVQVLSSWLKQPFVFIDAVNGFKEMVYALHKLLVSNESLNKMLKKTIKMDLAKLKIYHSSQPDKAREDIKKIALAFAGEHTVKPIWVEARLDNLIV